MTRLPPLKFLSPVSTSAEWFVPGKKKKEKKENHICKCKKIIIQRNHLNPWTQPLKRPFRHQVSSAKTYTSGPRVSGTERKGLGSATGSNAASGKRGAQHQTVAMAREQKGGVSLRGQKRWILDLLEQEWRG